MNSTWRRTGWFAACLWSFSVAAQAGTFELLNGAPTEALSIFQAGQLQPGSQVSDVKRFRPVILSERVGRTGAINVGDEMILVLFDASAYTARVDRVTVNRGGVLSVRARIPGLPLSAILISSHLGRSLVSIEIPELTQRFSIVYDSVKRTHNLLEWASSSPDVLNSGLAVTPPESDQPVTYAAPVKAAPPVLKSAPTDTLITILMMYTPAAESAALSVGGIELVIAQALERAQFVMDNSGVAVTLALAHSARTDYAESAGGNDSGADLDLLQGSGDGQMDEVHSLRTTYGADLVSLLADVNDVSGRGNQLTSRAGDASYAFSVVRVRLAHDSYALIHQIGHNLGCGHHKDQVMDPGPTGWSDWPANTYSAGWTWEGTNFVRYASIMCEEGAGAFTNGRTYIRAPHFSNPLIQYHGVETGSAGEANNALTIIGIKSVVAAYQTSSTYFVVFDAQGGDAPSPDFILVKTGYPYGTLATASRSGYVFEGWWTGIGGTGTEVTADTIFTNGADQVLYAKWSASVFTVTFDYGPVTVSTGFSKSVTFDLPYGSLPAPVSAGITFGGWWSALDGSGVEVVSTSIVATASDHTLYSKWFTNVFQVVFNAQGGSAPTPPNIFVSFGLPYGDLPTTTRSGYSFGGWWTSPGGLGQQITAETVSSLTSDQWLYAKWTKNLIVAFDVQGGTPVSPSSKTVMPGSTYGTLPATFRANFTFDGWWTGPGGAGVQVFANTPVTLSGNQVLYAKWAPGNPYTVTFDSQGGWVPTPTSKKVTNGSAYGTLATSSLPGYAFGGWWTSPGGLGQQIATGTVVSLIMDQILYAKWTTISYLVSFDAQGGVALNPIQKTVMFNTVYGPLATVTAPYGYIFGGWWTGPFANGSEVFDTSTNSLPSNHTLYASWTGIPSRVSFDAQGGGATNLVPFNAIYGSPYNREFSPADWPTTLRAGYRFAGWWTHPGGTGTEVFTNSVVTSVTDHILYAKWQPEDSFVVLFDPQGGSDPIPASLDVTVGLPYGPLAATDLAGFTFEGWWTDPACTQNEVTATNIVALTDNQILYAKWTPNYVVSFDEQGGTSPNPSFIRVTNGKPYGMLAATTRAGFKFGGWWTGPSGTGTEVTSATVAALAQDQVLYAYWIGIFQVSFDPQGGKAPIPLTKNVFYGSPYGVLASTTRSGHVFGGWWTGPGGTGSEVTAATIVSLTADQTLYAKWSPTFLVIFEAEGGHAPSPSFKTVTYGLPYGALAATTRFNHAFGGWWTGPGGTGSEVTAATIVSLTADQTLYAKWTPTYLVTFDPQGGTPPVPSTMLVENGLPYGPLATTDRAGFIFNGWWTGPGGTGSEVTSATIVSLTADQTLYAKWAGSRVTVFFDAQGGSGPSPVAMYATNGMPYGPLSVTARSGFAFAGWWTAPNGNGMEIAPATIVNSATNQTLYAKWSKLFLVRFNAQGGLPPVPASMSITNGLSYGPLATTSRAGFIFGGWWTGSNGAGTEITTATIVSVSTDQTLYAKWLPSSLTITPLNQRVGYRAGTTSFTVSYSGGSAISYVASESETWLSIISGASGGNSGTVTVSYDVNSAPTVRTGSVTVVTTGAINSTQSVSVVQGVLSSVNDFNSDIATDLVVFETQAGAWYVKTVDQTVLINRDLWGWSTARPVVGDYNGDGLFDLAVFDTLGGFWFVKSSDGSVITWANQWGWSTAKPVPGDYDGDGTWDQAVFDTQGGHWYIKTVPGTVISWANQWGWSTAKPVPGDYDGDGTWDQALFDTQGGNWYIKTVSGTVISWANQWGWSTAKSVPGDYDGDGTWDQAVFDTQGGYWYIKTVAGTVITWANQWGWSTARPISGDFDGDGVYDLAVFDSASNLWYIKSLDGRVLLWAEPWGFPGCRTPTLGD